MTGAPALRSELRKLWHYGGGYPSRRRSEIAALNDDDHLVEALEATSLLAGHAITLDDLSPAVQARLIEADDNTLKVARLFAVDNRSKPPKTQMNDQNFEFYLPEGASVERLETLDLPYSSSAIRRALAAGERPQEVPEVVLVCAASGSGIGWRCVCARDAG